MDAPGARLGSVVPSESAEQLFVRLVIAASSAERDLLLVLLDGSTPAEAAARLGVTPAVVKTRLHRIRRRAESVTARGTIEAWRR